MVNDEGDALRLDSFSGIPEGEVRRIERLEFGEDVCGTVAQQRRAIVATDIRGCRQVVDDGVTGRLVPRRDAHALADAIDALAADRGLRTRMGAAALAKASAAPFAPAFSDSQTWDSVPARIVN